MTYTIRDLNAFHSVHPIAQQRYRDWQPYSHDIASKLLVFIKHDAYKLIFQHGIIDYIQMPAAAYAVINFKIWKNDLPTQVFLTTTAGDLDIIKNVQKIIDITITKLAKKKYVPVLITNPKAEYLLKHEKFEENID